MDDYDDIDNNWGNKHSDYYEGRKLKKEKDEDNYIEEEEAAIKLQQAKLKKLKEMNLLDSDQEEETQKVEAAGSKKAKGRPAKAGKPAKQIKSSENYFDLSSSSSDSETNKKKKAKAKTMNKEEKDEMSQILKNIKIHINEIEENTNPIIEILKSESLDNKLVNTMSYLKLKKNLHLIYTIYNLYSLNYKNQKKISDHHPVWKKILMTKSELDGLKEKDSKIFSEIDNLLNSISENKNKGEDVNEAEDENDEENEGEDEDEEEESSEDEVEKKLLNKKRTKDFITDNENKFTKLKEKKIKKLEKEKENIIKEVDNKNLLGQRLANANILKSRGLYRKRKKYQGNAKLHLREKYSKKEKIRKNLVREYTGKPEVYGGEVTGIRRDLVRSTKIN